MSKEKLIVSWTREETEKNWNWPDKHPYSVGFQHGVHKALSYVMERAKQDCSTNEMDPSDDEDNMLISIDDLRSIIEEMV